MLIKRWRSTRPSQARLVWILSSWFLKTTLFPAQTCGVSSRPSPPPRGAKRRILDNISIRSVLYFLFLSPLLPFSSARLISSMKHILPFSFCLQPSVLVLPLGIRARVKELSRGESSVCSGLLTADTKMTFRSRSARIFWLVQMSYEMWDYAPDGEVYLEKFLSFARLLLENWRALDVSHSLSVVFFTRLYYHPPAFADSFSGSVAPGMEAAGGQKSETKEQTTRGKESSDAISLPRPERTKQVLTNAHSSSLSSSTHPAPRSTDAPPHPHTDRPFEPFNSFSPFMPPATATIAASPPVKSPPPSFSWHQKGPEGVTRSRQCSQDPAICASSFSPKPQMGGLFSRNDESIQFSQVNGTPTAPKKGYGVGSAIYEDFYRMALENESRIETQKLLTTLKKEALAFAKVLRWKTAQGWTGVPAKAARGNFLEAINVTLNVLEKHYMDRDLTRTGNSILMISPSTGIIEVDSKLSDITKQRMMDDGIGMDLLSLAQPPLHIVPLFICRDKFNTERDSSLFEVPHWMHISYFNSEGLSTTDNPLSSLLPLTSSSSSSSLPASQQRQSPSILSGSSEVPWSMRTGTYGPRGIERMEGLLEGVREKSIVPPPSLGPSLLPNGMVFRQGGRDGGREGGDCWSHQHQEHLDYHILAMAMDKHLFPSSFRPLSLPSFWATHATRGSSPTDDAPTIPGEPASPSVLALPPCLPPALRAALFGPSLASLPPLEDVGADTEGKQRGTGREEAFEAKDRKASKRSQHELPPRSCSAIPPLRLHLCQALGVGESTDWSSQSETPERAQQSAGRTPSRRKSTGSATTSGLALLPPLVPPLKAVGRSRSDGASKALQQKQSMAAVGEQGSGRFSKPATPYREQPVFSTPSGLSKVLRKEIEGGRVGVSDEKYASETLKMLEKRPKDILEAMTQHDQAVFRPSTPPPLSRPPTASSKSLPPHDVGSLNRSSSTQSIVDLRAGSPSLLSSFVPKNKWNGNHGGKARPIPGSWSHHEDQYQPLLEESLDRRQHVCLERQEHGRLPLSVSSTMGLDCSPLGMRSAFVGHSKIETSCKPPSSTTSLTFLSSSATEDTPLIRTNSLCSSMHQAAGQAEDRYEQGRDERKEADMKGIQIPKPSPSFSALSAAATTPPTRASDGVELGGSPVSMSFNRPLSGGRTPNSSILAGKEAMRERGRSSGILHASISRSSLTSLGNSHNSRSHHSFPSQPSTTAGLGYSSSGGATGGGPVGLRDKAGTINPFRREDEAELLQKRTHNHRRWSHVFPPGEVEFKHSPGPNWKSLCQPAILPLTTDYLPTPEQLRKDYTESFYTLMLPEGDDSPKATTPSGTGNSHVQAMCRSHADLLEEMVCQRLAQDFQLVETSPGSPAASLLRLFGALPGGGAGGIGVGRKGREGGGKRAVYTLSMGHRIHVLSYDESTRQVDVKHFLDRQGSNANSPQNHHRYRYQIWVPHTGRFQAVTQDFYRFPTPEYKWNYVDELICGYNDAPEDLLRQETKYRRKLYAMCRQTEDDNEQDFIQRVQELLGHVNRRRLKGSPPLDVISRGFPEKEDQLRRGGNKEIVNESRRSNAIMAAHIPLPSVGPQSTRQEWLVLSCDKLLDPCRAFHLDINWLVCSAKNARDFVAALLRKAQQLGLHLVPLPEYSRSSNLNVHPFLAHPFVAIYPPALLRICEEALIQLFGFVRDDERKTNWREVYLLEDRKEGRECVSALATSLHEQQALQEANQSVTQRSMGSVIRRKGCADRQYYHRSGAVFVRVAASAGFAWLHNHLLNQQHAQQVQQQYQREMREQLHEEYHHQQHLEQDLQRIYRPHRNLGIGAGWEDALHRFETYCRDAAFCYDLVQEMLAIAVMSIAEREAYYAECQGQMNSEDSPFRDAGLIKSSRPLTRKNDALPSSS
ncbi:dep domain containing protein [Nannochloropsis gaditana]|uniref:Dep domain containing protein n=1 Tax=Nannochloropsis gaditana TaxID=72520 RepID=W7T8Z9_9STRA|nr:dep domain containing protein [Nannochloropsis gaditana]